MMRTYHDMTAEDRALAARNQADATLGHALGLLDHAGDVVLSNREASSLLFAIHELVDRVAATAATWERHRPLTG